MAFNTWSKSLHCLLLRRFDYSRKQASLKQEELGTSMQGITGRRKERGFLLLFLACPPTTFTARVRRLEMRQVSAVSIC